MNTNLWEANFPWTLYICQHENLWLKTSTSGITTLRKPLENLEYFNQTTTLPSYFRNKITGAMSPMPRESSKNLFKLINTSFNYSSHYRRCLSLIKLGSSALSFFPIRDSPWKSKLGLNNWEKLDPWSSKLRTKNILKAPRWFNKDLFESNQGAFTSEFWPLWQVNIPVIHALTRLYTDLVITNSSPRHPFVSDSIAFTITLIIWDGFSENYPLLRSMLVYCENMRCEHISFDSLASSSPDGTEYARNA